MTHSRQLCLCVHTAHNLTCTAQGRNGAISVIALAERGALFDPGPCMYMDKLAGGPSAVNMMTLRLSVSVPHCLSS